MSRKINSALAVLAMLAFANSSLATSYNTVDVSTGVNVGVVPNALYATTPGTKDGYWMVRSTPAGALPPNTGAWIVTFSGSWNVAPGTRPIFGNNNNVGTSEYERCFCLQSTEKSLLTLTMRADNKANLFLNSYFNPVMQAVANNTFNPAVPAVQFTYTAQNGLKVGRNCIRVRVNNEGGPTGFALKASLSGFGALDNADQPCCRQGAAVFSEALRGLPAELDPTPSRENLDPRPDGERPRVRDVPAERPRP
ncbi:MAG TPA: hypothetical protein VGB76_10830 [Pyrinomonadaceae bacterium]|jgi:hypothetical protein